MSYTLQDRQSIMTLLVIVPRIAIFFLKYVDSFSSERAIIPPHYKGADEDPFIRVNAYMLKNR